MHTATRITLSLIMIAVVSACETTDPFGSDASERDNAPARSGLYDPQRYMEDDALPPAFSRPYSGQGLAFPYSNYGYGIGGSSGAFNDRFFRDSFGGP